MNNPRSGRCRARQDQDRTAEGHDPSVEQEFVKSPLRASETGWLFFDDDYKTAEEIRRLENEPFRDTNHPDYYRP